MWKGIPGLADTLGRNPRQLPGAETLAQLNSETSVFMTVWQLSPRAAAYDQSFIAGSYCSTDSTGYSHKKKTNNKTKQTSCQKEVGINQEWADTASHPLPSRTTGAWGRERFALNCHQYLRGLIMTTLQGDERRCK